MGLDDRIQDIQKRIADAAVRSRRQPEEITLLAVTKTFPVEIIRQAFEAGLRDFGENRVQEALPKISELPADIRWHLIGQLQTNKINKVIKKVCIDSFDRFAFFGGVVIIPAGRWLSGCSTGGPHFQRGNQGGCCTGANA